MTSITGFTLHKRLCDAFIRGVVMLPIMHMSVSRTFPGKLTEYHEQGSKFTTITAGKSPAPVARAVSQRRPHQSYP